MNKKGEAGTELTWKELIGIFIVIILTIFVFIPLSIKFLALIGLLVECPNEASWNSLKQTLSQAENPSFTSKQVPFTNKVEDGCYLVSFSKYQQGLIFPDKKFPISEKPLLCLCKTKNDNTCQAFDCVKFSNYESIQTNSGGQFSSKIDKETMFITLIKSGKTLRILKDATTISDTTLNYNYDADYAKIIDKTRLIKSFSVTTKDISVFNFLPYVQLMDYSTAFKPEDIKLVPSAGKFPIFFNIKLSEIKGEITAESIPSVAQNLLDSSQIKKTAITLNINKTIYNELTSEQKNSLAIFYKNNTVWTKNKLNCVESSANEECTAVMDTFYPELAISVSQ